MPDRAEQTRALGVASLAGIAMGFSFSNLAAIAEDAAAVYGVPLATIGVMAMAQSISHTVFQLPAGRLVDRFGGRHALLVGLALLALTNALPLLAPEAWLPILARAFMGVGSALAFVGGAETIRRFGPVAQGWYGGAGLGGVGLALAVMPALGALGWRAPWLAAAGLALLAAAASIVATPARSSAAPPAAVPPASADAARARPADGGRPGLLHDRALRRLAVVHMAGMGLTIVVGNWVVTLLTRAGEHSDQAAGIAGSLILLLGVATRPLGGLVMRRHPGRIRAMLVVGTLGCVGGTLLLVLARPYPVAIVGAILLGAAAGVSFAPAFTGAARRRPQAPGSAVGFVNAMGNAVVVVGTPLLGLAFSLPGEGRLGFLALIAFWLLALAALPRDADFLPRKIVASATYSGLPSGASVSKVPGGTA